MATNRIGKLLKKIAALLEDEDLNTLERDLAKKYLLEVYEFVDQGTHKSAAPVKPLPKEKIEIPDPVVVPNIVPSDPAPRSVSENTEKVVTPPKAVKVQPEKETILEPVGVDKPAPESSLVNEAVLDQPTKLTPPVSKHFQKEFQEVVTRQEPIPSKFKVLFHRDAQNELSEKLGLSPITDLRRALGINDKLLIVNQLFQGKQEAFQETIDVLNAKYSFSEAQSYLIRYVIDKYEWLDEERQPQARDFIKLVERRFLNS